MSANLPHNLKIVTAAQMTALELEAERQGASLDTLMENAGLAVAEYSRNRLGGVAGACVLVLVGPGNNGADGLVAARHLRRWGAEVTACLLTRRPDVDPKLDLARYYGVSILDLADGEIENAAAHSVVDEAGQIALLAAVAGKKHANRPVCLFRDGEIPSGHGHSRT